MTAPPVPQLLVSFEAAFTAAQSNLEPLKAGSALSRIIGGVPIYCWRDSDIRPALEGEAEVSRPGRSLCYFLGSFRPRRRFCTGVRLLYGDHGAYQSGSNGDSQSERKGRHGKR